VASKADISFLRLDRGARRRIAARLSVAGHQRTRPRPAGIDARTWAALAAGEIADLALPDLRVLVAGYPEVVRDLRLGGILVLSWPSDWSDYHR
jgi:hypothetical protein